MSQLVAHLQQLQTLSLRFGDAVLEKYFQRNQLAPLVKLVGDCQHFRMSQLEDYFQQLCLLSIHVGSAKLGKDSQMNQFATSENEGL
jgi:hypothetical protein